MSYKFRKITSLLASVLSKPIQIFQNIPIELKIYALPFAKRRKSLRRRKKKNSQNQSYRLCLSPMFPAFTPPMIDPPWIFVTLRGFESMAKDEKIRERHPWTNSDKWNDGWWIQIDTNSSASPFPFFPFFFFLRYFSNREQAFPIPRYLLPVKIASRDVNEGVVW